MSEIAVKLRKVLERAYADLDDEERKFFGKVLQIEHTYRTQTNPRGVVEEIEKSLERIVSQ